MDIMCSARKKLELVIGLYVESGRTIFSSQDLEESLTIDTELEGNKYKVLVNVDSKVYFSDKMLKSSKMEDHNVIHNVINNILKRAFRDIKNLRQIGKHPRFFDRDRATEFNDGLVLACPGFRASAFNYQSVMAVVVDSINKFIST